MPSKREPEAIILDGIVVNADQLKRYWQEETERRYRIRRGMFIDLESIEPTKQVSIPPEPEWLRQQWQSVQQLRAMVTYLNNKVTEMRAEKKKKQGQY